MKWYLQVLKKYAVFSGRAQRMEYWMFFLFNLIIAMLAVLLPGVAVTVRRLHDTGRSGWWLLIGFVPLIGGIVLLVFMVFDSQPGQNEYGPNPKALAAA
ncbi:MAG: DUF805 domain-containing protein [Candidatus Abyssubacteria bacterium]